MNTYCTFRNILRRIRQNVSKTKGYGKQFKGSLYKMKVYRARKYEFASLEGTENNSFLTAKNNYKITLRKRTTYIKIAYLCIRNKKNKKI